MVPAAQVASGLLSAAGVFTNGGTVAGGSGGNGGDASLGRGGNGAAGGTGVSFWVEPAEQMVSIYFVQGGSGGQLRGDVENAIRQAIIN